MLPNYRFVQADICDRAADRRTFDAFRPGRRHASRGRKPCRPLDHRRRATSSRPISSAPMQCSRRRATIGSACRRSEKDAFRFLHVSTDEVYGSLGDRRPVQRDDALRSELALFGLEGGLRSSRRRLASHLWPAGDRLELLEQLRTVPLPGEAHPADHPQCAEGKTLPVYGDGAQCARLALCRGSCPRARI